METILSLLQTISIVVGLTLVYLYLSMFITWLFYLAVMHIKKFRDQLTFVGKLFAYPMLYIGLFIDIIFNITSGTVFFFEPPMEFLFTSRCQRHLESKKTNFYARYQKRVAKFFCSKFMDPYDENGHC